MLHLEPRLHAERRAFLDGEGVLVEVLEAAALGEVDDYVWSAFDFEAQAEDDAFPRVVGVRDAVARADAEGLLPFSEGLVVLV